MKRYVSAETGRGFREVGGGVEVESMHMMRSSGIIPLKERTRDELKRKSSPPYPHPKKRERREEPNRSI